MNSTGRAIGGLFGALVCEVALIGALHWSASPTYAIPLDGLVDWFRAGDPTVALVAVARLVALAIGYWLLVTTVLYAAAHHLGWHALTDSLRWITLPAVRRAVQGVTAMSLTSASLMGPAAVSVGPALAQDVVVAQADDTSSTSEGGGESGSEGYEPDAAGWPEVEVEVEVGDDFWRPTSVTQVETTTTATTSEREADVHTVVAGDDLWKVSADHLRSVVGEVDELQICQYWLQVIDVNRATIRSGDPDLIFPDEQITLPPIVTE